MFRQVRARLLRLVGLSFGALRLVKAVVVGSVSTGKARVGMAVQVRQGVVSCGAMMCVGAVLVG